MSGTVDAKRPWFRGNHVLAAACERKNRYSSEYSARRIARDRLRDGAEVDRLWPYACANCRGWHLTKSALNKSVAVTARELHEGAGI